MTSSPATPHLDNHHRNTLRQIFQHPVSHNIEWHAVASLLEAIGTVDVHHDGKVTVQVGSEREILEPALLRHHAMFGGIEIGHAYYPATLARGLPVSQRWDDGNQACPARPRL